MLGFGVGNVAIGGGAGGSSDIVESGANANGEYVRYSDGTQVCWGSRPVTLESLETGGSFDVYPGICIAPFPAEFSGGCVVTGSIENGWASFIGSDEMLIGSIFSRFPSASALTVHWSAVGRWQ